MEINTGDVVQLSSGGPEMTVKGIIGDVNNPLSKTENVALKMSGQHADGDVYCQWFHNNKLEGGVFKPAMLKKQ